MRISERLSYETSRDYALRILKDNIIHLELAPGSMVSENELAAELGLSRTPVREALNELAKSRIVNIYPQRGSVISLIDYSMVEEACFLRNTMEYAVVELVCDMASPEDIRRLDDNLKLQDFYLAQNDADSLLQLDDQFHRTLFEIAHKKNIHSIVHSMTIHFDRVRSMSLSSVKNLKIVGDHRDILNAVAAKDKATARSVMQTHLTRYKIDKEAISQAYPQYFQ